MLQDPSSKKLRVVTIGAGLSGIQMAYQIQKNTENVEHVIYEKNDNLGGTWLENRYPGISHHFSIMAIANTTRLCLRHTLARLHTQLRAQSRLATLLLLRARHPKVPGKSMRRLRPQEVHDLQHRSCACGMAKSPREMDRYPPPNDPLRRRETIHR